MKRGFPWFIQNPGFIQIKKAFFWVPTTHVQPNSSSSPEIVAPPHGAKAGMNLVCAEPQTHQEDPAQVKVWPT